MADRLPAIWSALRLLLLNSLVLADLRLPATAVTLSSTAPLAAVGSKRSATPWLPVFWSPCIVRVIALCVVPRKRTTEVAHDFGFLINCLDLFWQIITKQRRAKSTLRTELLVFNLNMRLHYKFSEDRYVSISFSQYLCWVGCVCYQSISHCTANLFRSTKRC